MPGITFNELFDAVTAIDRAAAHGIHARTSLPSPTYDHLFTTEHRDGQILCVMRRGVVGCDDKYWEVVPA